MSNINKPDINKNSQQDQLIQDIQNAASTPTEKHVAQVLTEVHKAYKKGDSKAVADGLSRLIECES